MSTKNKPQPKIAVFILWAYDLWADSEGGYSVNDRFNQGEIQIKIKPQTFNPGTPYEFIDYSPTNTQLNRAINRRGIVWEGEPEQTLYGDTKNGKPVCELVFDRWN